MNKLFIGVISYEINNINVTLINGNNKDEVVGTLYNWVKKNRPNWIITNISAFEQSDTLLDFLGWTRKPETLDT